ncbi:MAG: PTS sugar transporter subunit IIB [Treponema sp.]|nr:PTS sugar transporter subunit IIB [Treponema sp.]
MRTTKISNNSKEHFKEELKMENVYLARVDDRLIHGQVMTAWMKTYPAKQIVIIDDEVVKDSFMINVLTMAAPAGVKVRVFGVEKAATLLKKGVKNPTILLAKTPITYWRLIDSGVDLPAVNLGGMGINGERKTLYKNLAASDAEREAIQNMISKGVDVKIQVIPADKIVDVAELLK